MEHNKYKISRTVLFFILLTLALPACKNHNQVPEASGTFEAVEIIVSAEADGIIKSFDIREGQTIDSGAYVGYIDSTQLHLKKKQLEAQLRYLNTVLPDVAKQTAPYQEQVSVMNARLSHLLGEKKRLENLLQSEVATPKQLDDINAQIADVQYQTQVIRAQSDAQRSALNTQRAGLTAEAEPLNVQIDQVNYQLSKSVITNPVNGMVLTKFSEAGEMTTTGKPLYSIADLSFITLRAYITGNQLPLLKYGQKVTVRVDKSSGEHNEMEGTVTWISDKAEFTPKAIQTRDERANLVYAVKIRVKNDGTLKIGMRGEVLVN